MTPPRRILLIAAPKEPTASIRRYRLGKVLMGPQQLLGERRASEGTPQRPTGDGRWRV